MSIDQKDYDFSDADELEGDEYRGISKTAVVAVLVALVSPVSMVHGLLAVVPVAAVILSLIALHGIARGESLVGRKAALFAMGLALFVLAWSISRSVSRQQMIENVAERHAQRWLKLVVGRKDNLQSLHEAYQLHVRATERAPKGKDLMERLGTLELPDSPEDSESYRFSQFFALEPLTEVIRLGADAEVRFDGTKKNVRSGNEDRIWQQFTITYKDEDGKQEQKAIVLDMRRRVEDNNDVYWWIESMGTPGSFNL